MKFANTILLPNHNTLLQRLSEACNPPELQKVLFPPLLAKAGQTISSEEAGLLVLKVLGNYCREVPTLFPRMYELLGPELIRAVIADDLLANVVIEKVGDPFKNIP